MKKCPFCAEEIQDAAIVCKHCGRNVPPAGGTTEYFTPKQKRWMLGGFAILVFIGWCSSKTQPPRSTGATTTTTIPMNTAAAATTSTPRPRVSPPRLAILSGRGYQSETGNYWYVEGEVKNLSDESLRSVQVVSTWYTAEDSFITSSSALIDYNPLLPGQTSPFKTITRGNPAMSKFSISFKQLLGGTIATRDDRPK